MVPPHAFTSFTEAQQYVREELLRGLPDGWAAQGSGPTTEPLRAAGSWRIARYDPVLRVWQGSDEYTLLTSDLTTFILTHSNAQPGPAARFMYETTGAIVPVWALGGFVTLGAFIADALRTYPPNCYDLT
jgi:hypothetical protein